MATAALAACGCRAAREMHHYRVIQSLALTVGADVDLPSNEAAIAVSVALTKMLGISFTTSPAVTIEQFDQLVTKT